MNTDMGTKKKRGPKRKEVLVVDGRAWVDAPEGFPGRNYGGRALRSRVVMAGILGRYLTREEVVHHKDGDRLNDSPENLQVVGRREHMALHCKQSPTKFTADIIRQIRLDWKYCEVPDLKELADTYRTSVRYLKRILEGKAWAWVKDEKGDASAA